MKNKFKLPIIFFTIFLWIVLLIFTNLASRKTEKKEYNYESLGYTELIRVKEGFPLNYVSTTELATTNENDILLDKVAFNMVFWLVVSVIIVRGIKKVI